MDSIDREGKTQRSPPTGPRGKALCRQPRSFDVHHYPLSPAETAPPCVLSGYQRAFHPVLVNSPVKSLPLLNYLAVLGLVGCISAYAADKPFKPSEAKTSKPDLLGQTRTELRDSRGQKVGDAVTTKPNLLGDTRTTLRDTSGKTLGEAVTRKPNLLGESKTTFKDARGTTIGQGVTTKPNLLGQTKTRFQDPSGRTLGEAVTTKPNLLGETKTVIKGGTPWSPSTTSGKSTTTLPSTNKR